MIQNQLLQALSFGLISAVSLPLGALVARFWIPQDRVLAALMAFGAGALLSALTIDLVGGALESGEFFALAAGAILFPARVRFPSLPPLISVSRLPEVPVVDRSCFRQAMRVDQSLRPASGSVGRFWASMIERLSIAALTIA